MKDLVGFLSDPNPKVKLETLSVILQYSATENQREQFYDTDLVKSVLHLHSDEVSLTFLILIKDSRNMQKGRFQS